MIDCQEPVIGSSQISHNDVLANGLACGFQLPSADNISHEGKTGFHSDIMWCYRKHVAYPIEEIGQLGVCVLQLAPPVGYVWGPKDTANLHWTGVVIIEVWINLTPVIWSFRWWIEMGPGGSQSTCCVIACSRCHFSRIDRCEVFLLISGLIILIIGWMTGSCSHCGGDKTDHWYAFRIIDRYISPVDTVFIHHIFQKDILVLGSIECLMLRINIHYLGPLQNQS